MVAISTASAPKPSDGVSVSSPRRIESTPVITAEKGIITATTVASRCFITLVRTIQQSVLESRAIATIQMRIGTFHSKYMGLIGAPLKVMKCSKNVVITLVTVIIVLAKKDMFFETRHVGRLLEYSAEDR